MSNLDKLAWNRIKWTKVQQRTFRIQRRIYKAKREDKKRVVHYLQNKLIHSFDAKLLAVQQVTTLNKGKLTKGIDNELYTTADKKWQLANSLKLNGKADFIRRVYIPKSGKSEKRPLGIPTIKDRAKQTLVKFALEPEWEAVFEAESYGFRPGRSCHDAMENIFTSIRSTPKYVLDADIAKCFDKINHDKLLKKLDSPSIIKNQIKAWLKADIMTLYANRQKEVISPTMGTPQGGAISPLLANIALHGLGNHLKQWYANSAYPNKRQGKKQRAKELGFIRYADDFVIICRHLEALEEAKVITETWLLKMGLTLKETKTKIKPTTEGLVFLGFNIILINRNGKYRCRMHIARSNKIRLLEKIRSIIRANKASSSYILIKKLAPIIIGWGNYFRYSDCSKDFQRMDHAIFGQLRAWVFRRKAQGKNRHKLKEKYFPSGKTYKYEGRQHEDNWVLTGQTKLKTGLINKEYLPKLSWISSKKFVKVKEKASIYDGNHIYWSLRLEKYSYFSPRLKTLIRQQNGKCNICNKRFIPTDIIEIDHIKPGLNYLSNCQALHKVCHIEKSRLDRVPKKLENGHY